MSSVGGQPDPIPIAIPHRSVLLGEVVEALNPHAGGVYIDATLGLGGHSEALLEASQPDGRVLGIDRDPQALEYARRRLARFGDRVDLLQGDFSSLLEIARERYVPADGIVADLGVSSIQLDDAERGFSFSKDGPLDMRMGPNVGESAGEYLERMDSSTLTAVLREFGEVERPHEVARAILKARDEKRLLTTTDLSRIVEGLPGRHRRRKSIHPATLVFQALRIAVNREIEELSILLRTLPDLLAIGGRAAIISFHSLEDRLVKEAFHPPPPPPLPRNIPVEPERPAARWSRVTKKPITPSAAEIAANPRARSAKLRVAERLS